jgi:CubicO group peptidase (beta-lactamase class C family)
MSDDSNASWRAPSQGLSHKSRKANMTIRSADGAELPPAISPLAQSIDEAIDQALREKRIVGCVVLASVDGQPVYRRAAGHADREAGRDMEVSTPFRFASLTKPFTTMAALKLVESGRLSPDDQVRRWLPEFAPRMADGTPAAPTVAHLLAHLAGLDYRLQQPRDGAYARAHVSDGLDETRPTLRENIARIASVPLDIEPGEKWRYSVATDVLGAVVAQASGKALPDAIEELVAAPLGLEARFRWAKDDLATPYYDGPAEPQRMNRPVDVPMPFSDVPGIRFDPDRIHDPSAWPSGGAGMAGKAEDVLTLLETFRAGTFLPVDLMEAARAPRIGAEAAAQGPGWGFSWLGAVLLDPQAAQSSLSRGSVSWGGVYGHWWLIDFARRLTMVSMTNTAVEGMIGQFARNMGSAAAKLEA